MSLINKLVLRNYKKGLKQVQAAKRNGTMKPEVANKLIESLEMSMKGAKEQEENETKNRKETNKEDPKDHSKSK